MFISDTEGGMANQMKPAHLVALKTFPELRKSEDFLLLVNSTAQQQQILVENMKG